MFPVCNFIYFPESPQRAYDVFAVTTAQEPDSKLRWKRLLRAEPQGTGWSFVQTLLGAPGQAWT